MTVPGRGPVPAVGGRVTATDRRETFGSRFGLLATMIGVAVGLGNVWRFPYMTGRYGGAAFVLLYLLFVLAVGVPALMAEWALGRRTGRGPVGAFEGAGLPAGRTLGWVFFGGVACATAYYLAVLGWVVAHAAEQAVRLAGGRWDASALLPPEAGFDPLSWGGQAGATALVVLGSCLVLVRGLRAGVERVSRWVVPLLLAVLLALIVRSLSLPGADAGLEWYLLRLDPTRLDPGVALAALGQAVFSLSLGGTYMVVYGSYLGPGERLGREARWTAAGDTLAGLLAGLALLPAVVALGLAPAAGPGLLFETLPRVFERMPAGPLFGVLFFLGLAAAAFLSGLGALEVLVAGLVDNTRLMRRSAVRVCGGLVLLLSLPPTLNLRLFVPWDLAFGSGLQTAGALLAVLAAGWGLGRETLVGELGGARRRGTRLLAVWIRWGVPAAIAAVGLWWIATEVLALAASP